MASMEARKGTRGTSYTVRWRHDGKLTQETFRGTGARADALGFKGWIAANPYGTRAEWLAEANPEATPVGGMTLGQWHERHAATRTISRARLVADDSLFRIQLAALHARPMAAISDEELRLWIKTLDSATKTLTKLDRKKERIISQTTHRAYSRKTIADALGYLRYLLGAATRNPKVTGLTRNVAVAVRAPTVVAKKLTASDVLTIAEFQAVLKVIPNRWRALFAVLGYTGARLSEALALTAADIDLAARTIHLGHTVAEEVGGHVILREGGKTRGSDRAVWITDELADELGRHMSEYVAGAGETIFRTEAGAIPNRSNLRQRQWLPAVKVAGVRSIPLRNLRHSHAAHCFQAGMPVLAVAARLGHSKPSMTLDTYARFITQESDDAARMRAWLTSGQR